MGKAERGNAKQGKELSNPMTANPAYPQAIKLLSPQQMADALGVCVDTVRNLRQTGELPYVKVGRKIMYKPSDIEAFIERNSYRDQTPCHSGKKVRRTGTTTSSSTVVGFEEALAKSRARRQKR